MKVGFGRERITPCRSMPMAGFDRREAPSSGVLDDLYVSAMALIPAEGDPFVMLSFDLLGVDRQLCRQLYDVVSAKLGIHAERLWVSATHTHSGPSGIFFGRENYDAEYIEKLLERSCVAANAALRMAETSLNTSAAITMTRISGIASLRDQARELSQYKMPLLLIQFANRNRKDMLCCFACHATVLDEKNTLFSRDLPGAVESAVRDVENVFFLNGACADLSTRYTRGQSDPSELTRLGELMASQILQARMERVNGFAVDLRTSRLTLRLPLAYSLAENERQTLLNTLERRMQTCSDAAQRREYDAKIAVLQRPPVTGQTVRDIDASAVDLGALVLVGLPFEVSCGDGRAIECELASVIGKPVWLACYTGGYDGYLPSRKTLTAESSYQDFASRYSPQVWQTLMPGLRAWMEHLHRDRDEKSI